MHWINVSLIFILLRGASKLFQLKKLCEALKQFIPFRISGTESRRYIRLFRDILYNDKSLIIIGGAAHA